MQPDPDLDLEGMTREALLDEVKKLREGIRKHRDAEGHSLCWYVPELWGLLPDRFDPKPRIPPFGEFLEHCAAYRASLDDALVAPIQWVPGQGLVFLKVKHLPGCGREVRGCLPGCENYDPKFDDPGP